MPTSSRWCDDLIEYFVSGRAVHGAAGPPPAFCFSGKAWRVQAGRRHPRARRPASHFKGSSMPPSALATPDDVTLSALHEAGHTVVGLINDFDLLEVRIDRGGRGLTRFAPARRNRSYLDRWTVRCLAGGESERAFFPNVLAGDRNDLDNARRMLGPSFVAKIDWLRAESANAVRAHRGYITAVALALLKHRHLTGDQVGDAMACWIVDD
jgi:hypothetical protein